MTAAQRCDGSRQLRCRTLWRTMPNNLQIFEHITSVQLAGKFYPEADLSQCLQQKKSCKKYSPKQLVWEPPSLSFKLSSEKYSQQAATMHEAAERSSLHPNPLEPNCAVHTAYPFIHPSFLRSVLFTCLGFNLCCTSGETSGSSFESIFTSSEHEPFIPTNDSIWDLRYLICRCRYKKYMRAKYCHLTLNIF